MRLRPPSFPSGTYLQMNLVFILEYRTPSISFPQNVRQFETNQCFWYAKWKSHRHPNSKRRTLQPHPTPPNTLNNKFSNSSPRWSAELWVPLGTIPGTPACGCIPPADQNKFNMDPKTRDPEIRVLYFCIYNNIIYPGSTMRTRILVLAFGTMIWKLSW